MIDKVLIPLLSLILGILVTLLAARQSNGILRKRLKELETLLERLGIEYVCLVKQFDMAQELAAQLLEDGWGKPDAILALSPGGEMVAQWLSGRLLGSEEDPIPVHTIFVRVTRRTVTKGKRKGEIQGTKAEVDTDVIPNLSNLRPNAKVLLVTDVVRSGHALQAAYDYLLTLDRFPNGKNLALAALACSEHCMIKPDYYYLKTDKPVFFGWKDKFSPPNLQCGGRCP